MKKSFSFFALLLCMCACTIPPSSEELHRISYTSETDGSERDYFLYIPEGYYSTQKEWPLILFLHGDGERGNGKDELDFVLKHGPLYEAWIQKKDLPFLIISPQMHMFGRDTMGISYIDNRNLADMPKRLEEGVPEREANFQGPDMFGIEAATEFDEGRLDNDPWGWNNQEQDLLAMINKTLNDFNIDRHRVYLTGLSYGGFGTWYMAGKYPEKFAAIVPVVGWGHPDLMPAIADEELPVWAFAGGLDFAVPKEYFYKGLNDLKNAGHPEVLFTIHEDMGHDAWKRVYAGDDVYNWMLSHRKN